MVLKQMYNISRLKLYYHQAVSQDTKPSTDQHESSEALLDSSFSSAPRQVNSSPVKEHSVCTARTIENTSTHKKQGIATSSYRKAFSKCMYYTYTEYLCTSHHQLMYEQLHSSSLLQLWRTGGDKYLYKSSEDDDIM